MRPPTSTTNRPEPVDLVIVGAGVAGSILALIAARDGRSVRVVDPNAPYPSDFRCEKFMGDQVAILEQLELCHVFTPRGVSPADSAEWLRHHGLRYDAMVNAVRRAWPLDVDFTQGRVASVETSRDIQRIILADGDVVRARLVVLATGPGPKLRESLGIERKPLRDRHSTCVGFSIAPRDGGAFTFQSLVRPGECAGDGMGFVSLFPLGETMRVNLFCYQDPLLDWTRAFRDDPLAALLKAMPSLQAQVGDAVAVGPTEIRATDLYETTGHVQPGVVLIGDAFRSSCPATGTGVSRSLVDLQRLAEVHLPQWLASPGMGSGKIAAFYQDPVKRRVDSDAARRAESGRSAAVSTTLRWRAHRRLSRLKRNLQALAGEGRRAA